MARKKNKQAQPQQPGQTNNPFQPMQNVNSGNASTSDQPTETAQGDYCEYLWYHQNRIDVYAAVDSWRSYRDGTNNLQTATDFQAFYRAHPTFLGNNQQQVKPKIPPEPNESACTPINPQGQQISSSQLGPRGQESHTPLPLAMDLDAIQHGQPRQAEASQFKHYQPLRMSNGTREKQVVQQVTASQQGLRMKLRKGTREQRATSTSAHDLWLEEHPSIPTGRYPLRTDRRDQVQQQGQQSCQQPNQAHQQAPQERSQVRQSNTWVRKRPQQIHQQAKQVPQERNEVRYPSNKWDRKQPTQAPVHETGTAGRIVPIPEKPRNSPRPGWVAEVRPPSPPSPSKDYEEKAGLDPVPQDAPARLLVILDLNGTLLFRPNKTNPRRIIVRPGVPAFLDYLFRNHVVMVYSSARPENCAAMLDQIFRPDQKTVVAAVWARDKLGLTTAQYNVKVQVYKKLEPVWRDKNIQKRAGPSRVWDQTNTVLVDDTKLKALAQPHNLLQIPEFMSKEPKTIQARLDWWRNEELMVQSVQQKLEELKFQTDVSRLIRQWQTGARPAPGVVDETVDQKALQNLDGREASLTPAPSVSDRQVSVNPQQLDTPCASPLPNDQKDLPQYKPVGVEDDGVSSGDEGGMTLDDLEQDINRNLSISQNPAKQKLSQPRQTAGAASAAGYAATTDETQRRKQLEMAANSNQESKASRKKSRAAKKRDRKERIARELIRNTRSPVVRDKLERKAARLARFHETKGGRQRHW